MPWELNPGPHAPILHERRVLQSIRPRWRNELLLNEISLITAQITVKLYETMKFSLLSFSGIIAYIGTLTAYTVG